ncbi:type II toxin-antitoxin system VapC family toxin [Tsukamurella asaccharolytica]|uniref:Type II toxin-antitoxin system VapC family toxin n=2 Tax=Tsukamurella asaccharolytica TaxID=2592067 RepID=A0A5C5RAE6_9ACTN|nr:type II toxin-antitoxin system VapC family toxin [Tsukamurella asaccharolytica]
MPNVIDLMPEITAIAAITAAELAAAPHLTSDPMEAARRQLRLQEVTAVYEPIPFDAGAAASYGLIAAAVFRRGRTPRRRLADLLIAATAHAHGLDVYTRNPDDFAGLDDLVRVVAI